jgi:sulfur-oxidizing protein SoxY
MPYSLERTFNRTPTDWSQAPLNRRRLLQLAALSGWSANSAWAGDDPTGGDPLGSMQWPSVRRKFTGNDPLAFSDRIVLKGPPFAEDAMNVPIFLDARALLHSGETIDRIVLVADRNPVQHILTFFPHRALPVLAFRFRLQQGSPVRALVHTAQDRWLVGQTWVNAAGGGCTVPGVTRADGSWSQTLNQVRTRYFRNVLEGNGTRLRVHVMHPMDTGLVSGIPAFYIEELELRDSSQQLWWRLEPHEPVSENPLITFELDRPPPGTMLLSGRDNNGNRIYHEVQA